MIVASKMGDANASIPTTEPVTYRHMFGAHGKAKNKTCITFVSKAAINENIAEKLSLEKIILPVENCRNIGKGNMIYNSETPDINGELITSKAAEKLPLTQLYNLF